MIVIIILLLFSLYMFWHFEQRRKIRNAEHHREKQKALLDLLSRMNKEKENKPTTKNNSDET